MIQTTNESIRRQNLRKEELAAISAPTYFYGYLGEES
jgi:hypothetical protein